MSYIFVCRSGILEDGKWSKTEIGVEFCLMSNFDFYHIWIHDFFSMENFRFIFAIKKADLKAGYQVIYFSVLKSKNWL